MGCKDAMKAIIIASVMPAIYGLYMFSLIGKSEDVADCWVVLNSNKKVGYTK